ncbi:MAG: UDP-N-acetylmuramate dehydrogenase [Bacteroidia bacterium]
MTNLLPYNTFGISALASQFIEINSVSQLQNLTQEKNISEKPFLILGSGSNILLTKNYEGLILKNNLKGIEVIKENENHVWVKAAGGEIWHNLVTYCVNKGWGGIENLSLIPGTVGAAPMQNIGAYGVEIKETFEYMEAVNMKTGSIETFNIEQCRFGYRESIFKHEAKGKYFIVSITLRLNKKPVLNTSYGDIETLLKEWNIANPTIVDVSKAVIAIRQSKLPDPALIGNAGSFFKNPVIENSQFEILKEKYPEIKSFPAQEGNVKIPAAWLIEQAGLKGKRFGNIGVHEKQALVLVNYGGGTGKELIDLAYKIIDSVKEKFGVTLTPEVNII